MIKMILAIGHINYDKFLNNMLEIAKQNSIRSRWAV